MKLVISTRHAHPHCTFNTCCQHDARGHCNHEQGHLCQLSQDAADANGEVSMLNWHALAGTRFSRTLRMLSCAEERFHRTLLAITIEPLRHLHSTYLRFAHEALDDQKWPRLIDEIWGPTSKGVEVLQYYSTLLSGRATRLKLLWRLDGANSIEEWIVSNVSHAKQTRRLLMNAMASVYRRHVQELRDWPWALLLGLFSRNILRFLLVCCRCKALHPRKSPM